MNRFSEESDQIIMLDSCLGLEQMSCDVIIAQLARLRLGHGGPSPPPPPKEDSLIQSKKVFCKAKRREQIYELRSTCMYY